MTRLGYQIPNFTFPGGDPAAIFRTVVAQAKAAEAAGFDRVLVMDHFYQLPGLGAHDEPMLECYTLLAALAQHTEKVRLSALVTGNTYRHPTLLAKTITALDHVSAGRATLGIGAGWFEQEHNSLGYEFGTFTDRFEKLEEALQIIIPMLRGQAASLAGKHYTTVGAVNSPAPVSHIPVMIGGGGERKTLRMVAQYADESNIICARGDLPRKLDALAEHCQNLGRARDTVTVSWQRSAVIAPTMEEAQADLAAYFLARGLDLDSLDAAARAAFTERFVVGDADTIGETFAADLAAHDINGFTVNMPASAHIPGRVELLGNTLAPLVR